MNTHCPPHACPRRNLTNDSTTTDTRGLAVCFLDFFSLKNFQPSFFFQHHWSKLFFNSHWPHFFSGHFWFIHQRSRGDITALHSLSFLPSCYTIAQYILVLLDRNGVSYDGWIYLKMMFASDMPGLSEGWITHRRRWILIWLLSYSIVTCLHLL